jgi:excisionase family DNA binding protein
METGLDRITEAKYRVDQVGTFLGGISKVTVWRMVRSGRIGHYRVGDKIFIGESHIDAYLRANNHEVKPAAVAA